MDPVKRKATLGIFALLVTTAPLLFGAVDREVQLGLITLLAIGLYLVPPAVAPLSKWAKRILGIWIALLVLKEFAPWILFGSVKWRTILAQSFEMTFPWMHNPEPGRVVDAMLAGTVAAVWFLWVRTLAMENENRAALMWCLLGAAAVVGVVSLAMHPTDPTRIYGIRFTNGWTGFGPFPNRNHTGCFLAMGALLGCGLLTSAIRHKKQFHAVAAFVSLLFIIVALFQSKSRGALVAFVIGLAVYAVLMLSKLRNRKALLGIVIGGAIIAGLFLAFGTQVMSRFHAAGEGEIATNLRWDIWKNTLLMWRDAPVFGHGISTFAQLFPLYENLKLENQLVLHPESSWLLWLVELGALPLLVAVVAGGIFLFEKLREAFERKQGFFLRASGFAALAVLLFHAMWDVPAHRWAIAAYALAILGVVCPLSVRDEKKLSVKRNMAFIPLGIAAFWALPFLTNFPAWSPTYLTRLISRDEALVEVPELEKELRYFSLNPNLHQLLGVHLLTDQRDTVGAWQHFRVADRLAPYSWPLPAAQAMVSRPYSSGMALHFWSLAIERAGHRGEEVFYIAANHTSALPLAAAFWSNYVEETHPQLLLSYSRNVPGSDGRYYFQTWWKNRAMRDDLEEFEIQNFYTQLPQYGEIGNLYEWMSHHPAMEQRDYKIWAAHLHRWKDDATAWKLLSRWIKEPEFPKGGQSNEKLDVLETKWLANPANIVNAQFLAQRYAAEGKPDKARDIVTAVAAQRNAPVWFLQKAAYQQAEQGRYDEAVANLLRN